ncbi:MAG: lipopolysaccharide biosynthesis protein [bacterium]
MRLSNHLDKGFWSSAVQVLIAAYGLAFMFLAVRVLPEKEFGNFVLIQMAFLIAAQLGSGFAFAPLVKYLYDYEDRRILLTSTLILGMGFFVASGSIIWFLSVPLGKLFNSTEFARLAFFIPILMTVSFGKFFTHQLLRALYRIRSIFLIELTYHGFVVGLIVYFTYSSGLKAAYQLLEILVISLFAASLVGVWLVRDQMRFALRLDLSCLRTLFSYGKYILGAVVNGQIYERLDVFMIAAFVGPVEVAVFQSAKLFMRILDMYRRVVNLLAMPGFSKLNSEKRKKDIKAAYEKGILFSHVLLVPLSVVLIIFAKKLYLFIYGGKYVDGVILLQIFAIAGPLLAWQCLGEGLLNGLGFPQISFGARTATTVIKVILNLILISLFQSLGAVIASDVAMVILASVVTWGVKSKIGFSLPGILSRFSDIINFIKMAKVQLERTLFI